MISERPTDQTRPGEAQPAAFLVVPVLPGRAEAWRRFVQELRGPQQQEWAAWRARVGLRRLRVWAQTTQRGTAVLIQTTFTDRAGSSPSLVDEAWPFDRWLREQMFTLHGIDLAQLRADVTRELILEALEES